MNCVQPVAKAPRLLATQAKLESSLTLLFLNTLNRVEGRTPYDRQLLNEVYDEALRFSIAYAKREPTLSAPEKPYAAQKIKESTVLYTEQKYYDLLLCLIGMVEDAETLSMSRQSDFIKKLLYFRDGLKAILVSKEYQSFIAGESDHTELFNLMEQSLEKELAIRSPYMQQR